MATPPAFSGSPPTSARGGLGYGTFPQEPPKMCCSLQYSLRKVANGTIGGVGPGEARKPLGTFWFGGLWSSVEWATFTNFLGSWHSWQSPLRRDIPSTDVLLTATQTVHRAILQGTGRQRAIQRDTEGIRHDVKPTTKPCLPEESRFVRTVAAKRFSVSSLARFSVCPPLYDK